MANKFKVGDKVSLPFGETGTIVSIVDNKFDWHPYKVKMRKVNPLFFNKTNQICDFKLDQLKKEI